MIYAITYKDFKGKRHVMFDKGAVQIYDGSELANQKYVEVQDRLADLLDGSPVKVGLFKKVTSRVDYPREKIAYWRQCLQTLEIIPYTFDFKEQK